MPTVTSGYPAMRVALYLRVSDPDNQTVENQRPVLEAWLQQRSLTLVGTYEECVSAWRNGHQRELSRLMRDARIGKFDLVAVWALDRLSRGGPLAIFQLVHTLGTYGVKVRSYQESWTETAGSLSELLPALTGWIAQQESQRRSERTKAGLARLKAAGQTLGRPVGSKDRKRQQKRSVGFTLRTPRLRAVGE